jgi:hypothetical protein
MDTDKMLSPAFIFRWGLDTTFKVGLNSMILSQMLNKMVMSREGFDTRKISQ